MSGHTSGRGDSGEWVAAWTEGTVFEPVKGKCAFPGLLEQDCPDGRTCFLSGCILAKEKREAAGQE
ncbi:MAG TPA: hypothetical protein VFT59_04575 [Candidatus Saccharimonadales bacterium]|nr:hypothetical protein [Candidatus Saccharimonadales bacterium]